MADLQLRDVVYHALYQGQEEEEPRDYIGISQIAFCERALWNYYIKGVKKEFDEATLLRFLVGTATHAYLLSLLWKHRGKVEGFQFKKSEKKVTLSRPGWEQKNIKPLQGHLDLEAILNKLKTISDFKIVAHGYFVKIQEAPRHNKIQLMMYAAADDAPQCLLAFVNKDNGRMKEFLFEPDIEIVESMLDKYERLMTAKEEPGIPFTENNESWECSYCQFADRCWPGQRIEKKEGVVVISEAKAKRYIELVNMKREIDEEMEQVKTAIISTLDGKNGMADGLTATFIRQAERIEYDSKKLIAKIDPTALKQCEKIRKATEYYLLRIKK